ncbi:MAG: hypothetical protein IGS50_05525 [Synechococcales cyanobacterium C42_A2020_086]|jgi:hypothetical protein|nr:hypothetical protein [Synechococcales cyanobacterium M58_A2018_015]MBF2073208.1 hypothetical protein [Synechococcales cyanobacterium C42_A2020_086]
MAIFRQYIAPLLIVLVFVVALVAVGARIFLPNDMAAPAPIDEVQPAQMPLTPQTPQDVAGILPTLDVLVRGLPDAQPDA